MRKQLALTHAVIASTLLMGPVAHADVTINTPNTNRNTQTANDGNITIATTGQLLMNAAAPNGGTAILVNTNAPTITLNANNTVPINLPCLLGSAICTTGGGTSGINISQAAGGSDAIIVVGAGTSIVAATDGIYADGQGSSIQNSGIIVGTTGSAINITTNGMSTAITNSTGGTLTGTVTSTTPTINVNGQTVSITNSGTISAVVGVLDAIQLNQSFSGINNTLGGTIQTVGGSGIDFTAGAPISGNVTSFGTITTATGNGINLQQTLNGSILNGGTINVTGAGGNGIRIGSGFTNIANSGTITAAAGSNPINVTTTVTGTLSNTGTIQGTDQPAITFGGGVTQFNNSGILSSTTASGVIQVTAPGTNITGGIINIGTITNNGVGDAIDLSLGNNIVLTQAGGVINGNVLLASLGGNIFTQSGGTINGNVFANNANPNILTLSGGTLNGNLQLGNMGDTVNLSGTSVQTITGGAGVDTINQSGGSLITLNADPIVDIYNLSGTVTATPGTSVTVGTIHLLNPATVINNSLNIHTNLLTLAAGSSLTNNAAITIGAGGILNNGTIYANAAITAPTLTNGGYYSVLNNSLTTITGLTTNTGVLGVSNGSKFDTVTFNQTAGSYAPEIYAPGADGLLAVGAGGATLAAGSYVAPTYSSGIYIPTGTTFDVLTSMGPLVDNSSVAQPNSALLFFTKGIFGGNTIRLTAQRRPIATSVEGQPAIAVGAELDLISRAGTTDPALLILLGQLDTLTTGAELQTALDGLTPTINYALVQASKVSIDSMFSSILYRVEKMKNLKPLGAEEYTVRQPNSIYRGMGGLNYGDGCCGNENDVQTNDVGVWIAAYGSLFEQKKFRNFSGYKGDSVGYAIGSDWGNPDYAVGGLALSYTNNHTVGNNMAANIIDVQSIQGTAYAWIEPIESVFIDAMYGFAQHKYYSRRNIAVGTYSTAAFGEKFYGTQYAVQTDLGYAFTYDYLVVAPVARFKYSYLAVDSYTETGAGGVGLSVENKSLKELVGGAGLRLLGHMTFAQAQYDPELSAMILYDFCADGQETSSNFLGGGGFFPTEGPNPSHTSYLYGLGITAYTNDHYAFQLKYNLQIGDRYHFYANSGFMQLRGEWG